MKAQLHSVRLDGDVWAAVKALPESLNKYLRRGLLDSASKPVSVVDAARPVEPVAMVRTHNLHSGTRPIAGCAECRALAGRK